MQLDDTITEQIDRLVREAVDDHQAPGVVAGVVRGDDVHVAASGSLALDGRPVGRDSLFRIASMTKPITAAVILSLVDEARLTLDESVDRLLPELANRRVLRDPRGPIGDIVPAVRPLTVRDLLTHMSGLRPDLDLEVPFEGYDRAIEWLEIIKLLWTREEEFNWAYFRPAGVIEVNSGVKNDGTVTAWDFQNYNSGGSGIQVKYDFPNQDIQFHSSKSPLRQGSYRGLAATANHFAREVHMDELAQLVGMDSVAFRLKNIKDARLKAVLEAAANTFGWGRKKSDGRGYGIACGFEKGSYIATAAEISIEPIAGAQTGASPSASCSASPPGC